MAWVTVVIHPDVSPGALREKTKASCLMALAALGCGPPLPRNANWVAGQLPGEEASV